MSSAGQLLVAGRIPGEQIAREKIESNSSSIGSTETDVASVTADLKSGRTYKVYSDCQFRGDTSGDRYLIRIREDSTAGTELQRKVFEVYTANVNQTYYLEGEYTPTSDETKTFVVTLRLTSGTGTGTFQASSEAPGFFRVIYVSG